MNSSLLCYTTSHHLSQANVAGVLDPTPLTRETKPLTKEHLTVRAEALAIHSGATTYLLAGTHSFSREDRLVRSESAAAANGIVDNPVHARARVIGVRNDYFISLAPIHVHTNPYLMMTYECSRQAASASWSG
jgi:hypothetical protein